ncbi:cytochrome P450 [Marinobacterium mangrovicola]|uniref:Cytochrome P450 n=1 Tax=Marinobacterium mangrovicola TaxID=1476959 RepID=A0A4V2PCX1_9GAMM|nr:cytochrome P450 [Marinobacterium mangrovicola]TCK02936.1 cytochrome P450 [Marinobacterium mangrovicola]
MNKDAMQTSNIDLFSDETLRNPNPVFAELREMAPVVWMDKYKVWAITRYDDVRDALSNTEVFSSTKVAFNDVMNEALKGTSLATDPPEHAQLRKTLLAPLTPIALKKIQDDITKKAETMIAGVVEKGSFDAIEDVARAFPLEVVTDMLGVQGEAREKVLLWGDAAFNVLGPMNQRAAENLPLAGELFEFCANVKPEELTEGSLGRGIFEAADRGEIARESCGPIIHQYIAAGLESTIAAIGNTLKHLAANPDQYALLVNDPSLVRSAFNESLRLEGPLGLIGRLVMQDVVIGDTKIPAGSQVALMLASANRDPRKFENPDQYLVTRNASAQLSFGSGVHSCAGQNLARIEANAILSAFVRRIKSFKAGEPEIKLANMTRSLNSLPVLSVETV